MGNIEELNNKVLFINCLYALGSKQVREQYSISTNPEDGSYLEMEKMFHQLLGEEDTKYFSVCQKNMPMLFNSLIHGTKDEKSCTFDTRDQVYREKLIQYAKKNIVHLMKVVKQT